MDSWIAVRLAVVIQLWREPVETSVTVSLLRNNGFSSGESGNLPSIYCWSHVGNRAVDKRRRDDEGCTHRRPVVDFPAESHRR